MTDEQIRLLLNLGSDEAKLLLGSGECALYRRIQGKMVRLVREYQVQLPLNCLQFVFCENRLHCPDANLYREPGVGFLSGSISYDRLGWIGKTVSDLFVFVGVTGMRRRIQPVNATLYLF